jgi:hypothetical protein
MIKIKESVMYISFKECLDKKKDRNNMISHRDLDFIIYVIYHIPKERRNLFISEMIQMEYLEIIKEGKGNAYCYKVLK